MPRSMCFVAVLLAGIAPLRADVTHVDNTALERLLQRGVPIIDTVGIRYHKVRYPWQALTNLVVRSKYAYEAD